MPSQPADDDVIDITGPEAATLFWHAKQWVLQGQQGDLQRSLDTTWQHYRELEDDRLIAVVAALCVEEAIQSLLQAIGPGFKELEEDADFSFSMKIKVARALQMLPARILTASDLVRQIRNAFAHNLDLKSFENLDSKKYLFRIGPSVSSFNSAKRDPNNYRKLFVELVGFILMALNIYKMHVAQLREWLGTQGSRTQLKEWAESQPVAPR